MRVGYTGSQQGKGVNAPGDSLAASVCSCRRGGPRAGGGIALGVTPPLPPRPLLITLRPEAKARSGRSGRRGARGLRSAPCKWNK